MELLKGPFAHIPLQNAGVESRSMRWIYGAWLACASLGHLQDEMVHDQLIEYINCDNISERLIP